MSIEKLIALAPPPQRPMFAGTSAGWDTVQREIGVEFPVDYKQLINLYGLGYFGKYVCPLNPFIPDEPPLSLYRLQSVMRDLNKSKKYVGSNAAEGVKALPVYPEAGGLLPWGVDDDRGLQCWVISGDSVSWPTLVLDYDWSEEYLTFSMSCTEFIVNWLIGEIAISYFPPQLSQGPLFSPFSSASFG